MYPLCSLRTFASEVAGVGILGTIIAEKETEIGLYVGELMSSELSGNLVDVCPIDALTMLKPYAFSARPSRITLNRDT